ncbi:hypothetical protein TNCT_222251 [Trichonephila clavata]|uniref:Serine/threonine-protein phosphatase 4 regulatory subunit 2 n=1 Tax=Trichonephila clavata TaxID=2740835 RepID=A0A8X6FII2_TRICU|nr:hypothetical protein TNCT_222251 [Trichonephila clavata]
MEWNAESVLDALNDFERKLELSPILEDYLKRIAKNGEIVFPWSKLKPLLRKKLEVVLDEFHENYPVETSVQVPNFETFNFDSLKKTILQAVESFTSAPFTIQRLCELVTDPTKHYDSTDKYMRGIEKNVLVVSTIEPRSGQGDGNNANNPVVNGLLNDSPRDDNDTLNGHENTDSVSSSNINTSSNHVLLENFANVFPSAACIPSASNICINREIDNNFLSNSECVDTQDVDFESSPPVEQLENVPASKEEEMDTTADEQVNVSVNSDESTSDEAVLSGEASVTEPEKTVSTESSDDQSELDPASSNSNDNVSASENVKIEADCSESQVELPLPNPETAKPTESQQDDTVSQSDENSCNSSELSQSSEASDAAEITQSEDTVPNVSEEVSQSVATNETSDTCMELESSTNSAEPVE